MSEQKQKRYIGRHNVSRKSENHCGLSILLYSVISLQDATPPGRLSPFFGVKNFEFQYFLGFRKMNIFWWYEDFVDIFLGSSQNWTLFRGHFYAFYGLFLRSRYRMRDAYFWVAKISNIFLGCLKFLKYF